MAFGLNDFSGKCREMELKEKQEKGLNILLEIDRICKKYHIAYRLDAGTLLGAIRHKGFIPWDDDVDLCFLREDWEQFEKVAKDELSEKFALVFPNEFQGGKAFYDFVPRVVDLSTRRRASETEGDSFYEGKLNHLWVDCFILDDLPNVPLLARLFTFRQQMIFGLAMGHRRRISLEKYKGISRLFVFVLSQIGRRIPMPFIFSLQEKWARAEGLRREKKSREGKRGAKGDYSGEKAKQEKTYSDRDRGLYFSNYQPDFQYCISRYSWEKPLIYAKFESYEFPVPKGYDELLRMLYGKYEILPKEENRVPAHEEMI